jgi:hypothetical protein
MKTEVPCCIRWLEGKTVLSIGPVAVGIFSLIFEDKILK